MALFHHLLEMVFVPAVHSGGTQSHKFPVVKTRVKLDVPVRVVSEHFKLFNSLTCSTNHLIKVRFRGVRFIRRC